MKLGLGVGMRNNSLCFQWKFNLNNKFYNKYLYNFGRMYHFSYEIKSARNNMIHFHTKSGIIYENGK